MYISAICVSCVHMCIVRTYIVHMSTTLEDLVQRLASLSAARVKATAQPWPALAAGGGDQKPLTSVLFLRGRDARRVDQEQRIDEGAKGLAARISSRVPLLGQRRRRRPRDFRGRLSFAWPNGRCSRNCVTTIIKDKLLRRVEHRLHLNAPRSLVSALWLRMRR